MSMVVRNNLSAVNTLNTLNRNQTALSKNLEMVSSGMRINSARDDASGYAISERMRVQIRSLNQDNLNTQNGNSMMKVAEGAVQSTVDILKTLKEKVIDAANDTNTDADRAFIQKELDQSIDQINDNANVTYNGKYLVDNDMLNGVVGMILVTCILSSLVTDWSSRQIILHDKTLPGEDDKKSDDEKILIPVRYEEYADNLISLAILMRNQKLNRGLVALNVVYDDKDMRYNQQQGRQLLEQCVKHAASADVKMQTQVRIAANIANGIKHAFKEFQASEIIIGMHMHKEVSRRFWGEFHQSLFNGLSRQIIMARLNQPLNTIRRIQVAVPSRAEFEPGFYRWIERLVRLARNLDCRILFHGRRDTLALINEFVQNQYYQDIP